MSQIAAAEKSHRIKEPKNLSPRIAWLRDYYFQGAKRAWNNEFTAWTTGTPWDVQFDEMTFYIVPETYTFLQTFRSSMQQAARAVPLHPGFLDLEPARAQGMVRQGGDGELRAPGDPARGSASPAAASTSRPPSAGRKEEAKERDGLIYGKQGARARMKWFHDHGYGNAGATSGHLIPGYERALTVGWKGIRRGDRSRTTIVLGEAEKAGPRGTSSGP